MKKLLIFFLMLSSIPAMAGGYRVALQGARMLGMAHAGVSVFNSAETAFFNPSGVAFLEGENQFSLGVNLVFSKVKFQNTNYLWTAETQNPVGTPFYAYFTHKIDDRFYLSLAVYTPYGSTVEWDQDWVGSHLVNKISLKAIYFQPSLSFKVNDFMSVGASFIAATGSVFYNKNINRFMQDADGNRTDITLDAKGVSGSGYALSLSIKPSDRFALGVTYRSKVLFKARYGKAEINDNPGYLPEKDNFKATLPMPAELSAGISAKITDKWLVAFDVNETYWSVYKSLDVDFNHLPDNSMPKNWHDTFTYRLGSAYTLTDALTVRAGYYYDHSPISKGYFSPDTPSLDSNNYTFGMSYRFKNWTVDASFLYAQGLERTDSYDYYKEGLGAPRFVGSYISNAYIASLGVNYKF
ncbi:MAG: transporter [Chlorobi bacterium]|nr:transporter [Chlorobiota bacterium]